MGQEFQKYEIFNKTVYVQSKNIFQALHILYQFPCEIGNN